MELLQIGTAVRYLPEFIAGAWMTVRLSLVSLVIGIGLGALLALARTSGLRRLSWPSYAYIEFFRTTPPLVQIVWLYFVGPVLIGRDISAFVAASVALGLNIAAFLAEIFRAGLEGVGVAQREAAHVLGLSAPDTLRFVVLPQAARLVLPPTGTTIILLVKSTSLASAIGLLELTRVGQLVSSATYRPAAALTVIGALYFVINFPIAVAARRLEKRLGRA